MLGGLLGDFNPLAVFREMPREARAALGAMLELAGAADTVGYQPTPRLLAQLFALVERETEVPADLLAAVAVVRSGFDTAHRTKVSVGLMGLTLGYVRDDAEHVASIADVAAGEARATSAVRTNVEATARAIAARRDAAGLGAALVTIYGRDDARSIVGAFALYSAQRMPAERFGQMRSMLGVG